MLVAALALLVGLHEWFQWRAFAVRFPVRVDGHSIDVQVAARYLERLRGLQGRTQLGPEEGMLFVYPNEQDLEFWMRNTPLPLDLGFFDSRGALVSISALEPYETRKTKAPRPSRYALEMPRGWFAKKGVAVGALLDLRSVETAMERRMLPFSSAPDPGKPEQPKLVVFGASQ